jgi:hypothetical protein
MQVPRLTCYRWSISIETRGTLPGPTAVGESYPAIRRIHTKDDQRSRQEKGRVV